ncbi:MAG: hypothetical protein MJA27_04495 [Pseudanabaenales cyanobacterium]|nr:hypothetical protein [Pseudanabaenales cyanobacterium]
MIYDRLSDLSGCRFPARQDYRLRLQTWGRQIGQNLAAKGALERFSVDLMAVRNADRYR